MTRLRRGSCDRPPVARPRRSPRTAPPAGRISLLFALTLALAACGGAAPTGSFPGGRPESASPAQSGAPPSTTGPKPTSWPGTTAASVTALGAADAEIAKAAADLQDGVEAADPRRILGAADGLVRLLDEISPNVDRIEAFSHTKALAEAYRASLPALRAGAARVRDSITAGDAAGVEEGFRQIDEGMRAYVAVRPLLSDLVPQALEQQRLYVK